MTGPDLKRKLPTNPLHIITLASVAATLGLGTVYAVNAFRGEPASDAWFLAAAMALIPGIAATSLRVFLLRNLADMTGPALVMMAFPGIMAFALGLDVLDPGASHRLLRGIAAASTMAAMTPAATALVMRDR